ncbi:Transcriptional regulator, MarR family [[Actinomadura] parvosata subsp. kistnae]|uniref:MarR family transcriptional regulator n=1 Tax=[Actinomadura] parvosata subsp. kistnae TaxID=1909395 RepID=A0A1V0A4U6_9ACTN|nr:MarR family winged helix-turn-helix transcriptional regulator [Nonomuraea sp. ATCC 55076]AQZ65245.1 MarR family transcriptional regulator [Nonomuraea sp. ATCC 55076]SPL96548.1 Transcriptional regulator, MarR family [Actinomadura parvosata subsp. kistnae]
MSSENDRPAAPTTSASIVVLTLARQVEAELGAALAPLDLTVSRLGLLGHIAAMPGVSFSELARMSGITVQSVHAAVKALAGAGLVRDHTARAGSASAIEVTPEGARLMERARAAVAEVDERLFGESADPIRRQVGDTIRAAFSGQVPSREVRQPGTA